jgi:hypothetical protein
MLSDLGQHLRHPFAYLLVCESEYGDPVFAQYCLAGMIPKQLRFLVMIPTIALNRQQGCMAVEIADVPPELMLPAEFQPLHRVSSQLLPQQFLRAGLSLPQRSRLLQESGYHIAAAVVGFTEDKAVN